MKKISPAFIKAQAAICQEVINNKAQNIDKIVRLSKEALMIATEHERINLLITMSTNRLFSTFRNYLDNQEKIPGLIEFDCCQDSDEDWEQEQLDNDFKNFTIFDDSETAVDAVQRYYHFTTILQKKSPDCYIENQITFFSPPVTQDYIKLVEEDIGITLPKSYIRFISEMGFFSFGTNWRDTTELIPIDEIVKENIVEDLCIPWDLSETPVFFDYDVKDFDNGYIMARNPEDNYRRYKISFWLQNHKNKQGELLFINGDHDGFEEYEDFNIYMQKMINARIMESLEPR